MVFGTDAAAKQAKIREMAYAGGLFYASIQNLYDAMGKKYGGFTVPAVNVRGVTFDFARAMFRAAIKNKVGPFVFEIARSELAYTKQTRPNSPPRLSPAAWPKAIKAPSSCSATTAKSMPRITKPIPNRK